jgi:hypothetical protein
MLNLFFLFLFTSCSGYRFSQQQNPLSQYGINSLSLPMFYNYSNISDVHADFTRETYRLLTGFSGLKLMNGYSPQADAVLIGIVKSPEKISDTIRSSNLRLAQAKAGNAIGRTRQNFYVSGSSDVALYLQIIVIKKPTLQEMSVLQSNIGAQIRQSSKIIFNELLPIRFQYTKEILDDDGTQVVGTQNSGVQRRSLKTMAEQAAISVRDMILYAF